MTGQQRLQTEAKRLFDLPCPIPVRISLSIRAITTLNQSCIDERCERTAKRCAGYTVGTNGKLCIGWENDQTCLIGQLAIRIEAQQCVQYG
ncbi:hypothetical protein DR92_4587 (plasmid) [Brucella anthropi]|nr:hypothetical protein DR92_4587 [Brucella anthropi]